jgi:hypothetical protein
MVFLNARFRKNMEMVEVRGKYVLLWFPMIQELYSFVKHFLVPGAFWTLAVRVLFWVRLLLNEGFPSDNVEELVLPLFKLVVNIRGTWYILLATF